MSQPTITAPTASTPPSALIFYQFLGAHSLLIGLFPFYLPVWMWKMGFDLADICAFVAISGLSFVFSLRVWERLASRVPAATLFGLSFVFELVLVVIATCEQAVPAKNKLEKRTQITSSCLIKIAAFNIDCYQIVVLRKITRSFEIPTFLFCLCVALQIKF